MKPPYEEHKIIRTQPNNYYEEEINHNAKNTETK